MPAFTLAGAALLLWAAAGCAPAENRTDGRALARIAARGELLWGADEQGGGYDPHQPGGQRQMPRGPPGPSRPRSRTAELALAGPAAELALAGPAAGGAPAWLAYPPDAATA